MTLESVSSAAKMTKIFINLTMRYKNRMGKH